MNKMLVLAARIIAVIGLIINVPSDLDNVYNTTIVGVRTSLHRGPCSLSPNSRVRNQDSCSRVKTLLTRPRHYGLNQKNSESP